MRGGGANAFAPFLRRFRLPLFEVAFSPKERVFSWGFAPPVFARFARFSGCGRFLPPVFGGGEARFQARSACRAAACRIARRRAENSGFIRKKIALPEIRWLRSQNHRGRGGRQAAEAARLRRIPAARFFAGLNRLSAGRRFWRSAPYQPRNFGDFRAAVFKLPFRSLYDFRRSLGYEGFVGEPRFGGFLRRAELFELLF